MNRNFFNEVPQMHGIMEQQQLQEWPTFNSVYQSQMQHNMNFPNNYYDSKSYTSHERPPATATSKVYVNPNYTRRKPVIHINPHVQVKPSIYVNPKLIQNMTNGQNQKQVPKHVLQINHTLVQPTVPNKCSVYINPKLIPQLISKVPEESHIAQQINNLPKDSIISSTLVSATLDSQSRSSTSINKSNLSNVLQIKNTTSVNSSVKKLLSVSSTPIAERKLNTNYIIKSKTKLVKNTLSFKKSPKSNLVALSQRKLVKLRKNPKSIVNSASSPKLQTPLRRKSSALRKTKISPKSITLNNTRYLTKIKSITNINKYKVNWYNKFDKNISKSLCKKKVITAKEVINNTAGLVRIGDIMYKTTRNQLIRSSPNVPSLKRRRSLTSNKNQYYIAKNGKKLLKLDSTQKKIDSYVNKSNTSLMSIKSYKTNISNKVKQRSLQILRNKMRKNNQPCLLFQRFGYCANQLQGTCPKVHDKKQVALCRNFLQGTCLLDNCPMSHNVGPEKMPTCKYFLEGCCTRDGCPYLHVKVSSKNPICVEFLRGYCPRGNECQKRHIYACPEFDKSGKCSKGKFCPYPHKSHLTESKQLRRCKRRKSVTSIAKQPDKNMTEPQTIECRKRYYDDVSEDFNQKRENLLKHVKIIKDMHIAQSNNFSENKDSDVVQCETDSIKVSLDYEEKQQVLCNKPRRPPLGPLPAYIPIE